MLNELLIKDLSNQVSTNQTDIQNLKTANTYSTTETVCGTWTDGKPIYRVVIETTTPTTVGNWKEIYTGHSVYKIISYGGYYTSSATLSWAIPLNTNERNFWFSVNSSNNIQMAIDSSYDVSKNVVLWFDYVKTS